MPAPITFENLHRRFGDRWILTGLPHRLYPTMRVGEVLAFEAATRVHFDRALARRAVCAASCSM